MPRINVYARGDDFDGLASGKSSLIGHFNSDTCTEVIGEGTYWDGNNHRGNISGLQIGYEELLRTAGGRWVLHHDGTHEFNGPEYHQFLSDAEAQDWLIRAKSEGADQALETHFGGVEEEVGPNIGGRPAIGKKIEVRLDESTIAQVDARAAAEEVSRAEMLRRLVIAGL